MTDPTQVPETEPGEYVRVLPAFPEIPQLLIESIQLLDRYQKHSSNINDFFGLLIANAADETLADEYREGEKLDIEAKGILLSIIERLMQSVNEMAAWADAVKKA